MLPKAIQKLVKSEKFCQIWSHCEEITKCVPKVIGQIRERETAKIEQNKKKI